MHIPTLSVASTVVTVAAAKSNLWVDRAPNHVRPYVIEHYAPAQAVSVGAQVYRFPVTGPASGGKFSLLSTSSPASDALGVLPHLHQTHFENFFALKGRFQLWTEKEGEESSRLLTVGDYGACPRNTTHTFQIMDPDTEMVGVISPGGFEELFFFLANSNYSSSTDSPFVPAASTNSAGGGSSADIITTLESLDVYAQLSYNPRRDIVNGSAPSSNWHTGSNSLANNSHTPYYIAKDFGPKYIHNGTFYQIVQPFVTNLQSADTNFTEGTITMSRLRGGASSRAVTTTILADHHAFEVLEGVMKLTMSGETVTLITGDVAFIPGGTQFKYWSEVAFTKVLYVGAGTQTLDRTLMANASSWDYAVFPTA
ncbi:hypothetical protein AAFC00_001206 [Neodothiora populina]|uniref:Quercetin 2,3-dioxygenase n=1 Tax=Neodothiora populina TaxID=2781224 RepID=A0ABR3PN52_9PEZI